MQTESPEPVGGAVSEVRRWSLLGMFAMLAVPTLIYSAGFGLTVVVRSSTASGSDFSNLVFALAAMMLRLLGLICGCLGVMFLLYRRPSPEAPKWMARSEACRRTTSPADRTQIRRGPHEDRNRQSHLA